MRSDDFSLQALFAALDAERRAQGLSWAKLTQAINGYSGGSAGHRLSPSTVTGTRTRAVAEGDGVLQMLRWLKRTPESFVPGQPASSGDDRSPEVPSRHTLRFDAKRIHAALNAQRVERRQTWAEVAQEVGVGVSSLTHLSQGGRTAFPQVMRIVRWLAKPAAHFTRTSNW